MAFLFRKAERKQLKLRVALIGPSGSGKTYSALRLATGIAQADGGKIVLIDTENRRGEYYADEFAYDTLDFAPPFSPERFIDAISAAEDAGYDVIILDSASHEWIGPGGTLSIVDNTQSRNDFSKWKTATPRHDAFINKIIRCKAHIILCLRAKDHYVVEPNGSGKQAPKKVGLGPQQRDGIEYECTVSFMLDQERHIATAQKDNTHIFDGQPDILTETHGVALAGWADQGIEEPEIPVVTPEQVAALREMVESKGYDWQQACAKCLNLYGEKPERLTEQAYQDFWEKYDALKPKQSDKRSVVV